MNKRLIWIVVVVLLSGTIGVFAYNFFKQDWTHLTLIEKNEELVVKINLKDLIDKSKGNGKLEKLEIYKENIGVYQKTPSNQLSFKEWLIKRVSLDPKSSGLGLNNPIFACVNRKIGSSIIINMRNINSFNRLILKYHDIDSELKKTKDFYFVQENNREIFAWNERGLVFLEVGWDDNALESVNKFFKIQKDESAYDNRAFNEFCDKKSDVAFRVNGSFIYKDVFKNHNQGIGEIYTNLFVNFEKDKIQFSTVNGGDKELLKILNVSYEKGVSDKILSCLAKKDLMAYLTLNLDVSKLIDAIEFLNKKQSRSSDGFGVFTRETGISISDLKNSLKGEIALSLEGFKTVKKKYQTHQFDPQSGEIVLEEIERDVKEPVINFVTSLKSRNAYEKFIKSGHVQDTIDGIKKIEDSDMFIAIHSDVLFFSNELSNCVLFKKNGNLNNKSNLAYEDFSKENYFNFYVNIDYKTLVRMGILNNRIGMFDTRKIKENTSIFKDIHFYSEDEEVKMEINLTEGKDNSLFRVIEMIDAITNDK